MLSAFIEIIYSVEVVLRVLCAERRNFPFSTSKATKEKVIKRKIVVSLAGKKVEKSKSNVRHISRPMDVDSLLLTANQFHIFHDTHALSKKNYSMQYFMIHMHYHNKINNLIKSTFNKGNLIQQMVAENHAYQG